MLQTTPPLVTFTALLRYIQATDNQRMLQSTPPVVTSTSLLQYMEGNG
jgi:hypothetical protein